MFKRLGKGLMLGQIAIDMTLRKPKLRRFARGQGGCDMIGCDGCDAWFPHLCIGLPLETFHALLRSNAPFRCRPCGGEWREEWVAPAEPAGQAPPPPPPDADGAAAAAATAAS